MRELLYCILFSCVFAFVILLRRKFEHLTPKEKPTTVEDRLSNLEDEYKDIQVKLNTQESRMGAASTQASQAQALLHANID